MLKEIFKAGTHTDSAGNKKTWTVEDLHKIANLYNEQKEHEAPLVLGHPKTDDPAYGWVEKLKVEGNSLFGEFKQLATELTEWIKEGRYKKTSISLYPNMLLRHVGFLGAIPPAVKGLGDLAFKEDEEFETYEFSEFGDSMNEEMIKKIVAMTSKKFGADVSAEMEKMLTGLSATPEKGKPEFSDSPEYKAMLARQEKLEAENKAMKFDTQFGEWLRAGKVIPAQKDTFKELYIGIGENQFGEKTGIDLLTSLVDSNIKLVEFNELATNGAEFAEETKSIEKGSEDAVEAYYGGK